MPDNPKPPNLFDELRARDPWVRQSDTCSCLPGACHGGHTINMGMPVTAPPTDGDRSPQTTTEPLTFTPTTEDIDATVDLWRRKLATADGSGGLDDVVALATLAYATVPFLLDGLDATRARIAELEAADREHSQTIEYLHHTHGIDIDREHADFREWQQQYGKVSDRG